MTRRIHRFRDLSPAIGRAIKSMPKLAARPSVQFFKSGFTKKPTGLLGATPRSSPWKKRKSKRLPHPVLNLTGDLMRSIRTGRFHFSSAMSSVSIVSDLEYSQIHNEGGIMAHGGIMPQRKFLGESKVLTKKIRKIVVERMRKAFR